MKLPIDCPFCNNIMITDFPVGSDNFISKECFKRLDHKIKFISTPVNDEVTQIIIRISDKPITYAKWIFNKSVVRIESSSKQNIYLPWFEPELNDYCKLVDKIRTYVIFS
jgi:hypothetical protein